MSHSRSHIGLHYRLVFYLGGFLFAFASYVLCIWAFGLESAGWGDRQLYADLLRNLSDSFQSHMISLFVWQAICVSIAGVIGHLFDGEVRHRRIAELRANIDGLTEIYNHRYFQERLVDEIDRTSRYGRAFSVAMFDIDNFKAFNDTWGHQEGDKVLKWFAGLCESNIRGIDVLARYGGEEFVVIFPETGSSEAFGVVERIRAATEKQSISTFGRNKAVTVSAGVACYPDHGASHHALVLSADAALYSAKQQGKNRVCLYEQEHDRSYWATSDHIRPLLDDEDMEAMEALAAAADAKESHSKGHSIAVANLSLYLGEELGFSAEELANLRMAALLHDLGRIATPEEILKKREPLRDDEWKIIENHPKLGSRIIRRVQQMDAIIPGVKHHHERYDGKGYPSGLAGKNIPLLARIIAIADAHDAMTTSRPYRDAMSSEDAIEELQKGAGAQFDPDLVDIFLKVLADREKNSEAA